MICHIMAARNLAMGAIKQSAQSIDWLGDVRKTKHGVWLKEKGNLLKGKQREMSEWTKPIKSRLTYGSDKVKLTLELKIKDKTIKLTEEEARELGETLATMFDLKKTEWISYPHYVYPCRPYWWYGYQTWCNADNDTTTYTFNKTISDNVSCQYQLTG